MKGSAASILNFLQQQILPLQGFKPPKRQSSFPHLAFLNSHFPHNVFPLGTIHEFINQTTEDTAATTGFISAILSHILPQNGPCLWIHHDPPIFPHALRRFGIAPDQIIFVKLKKANDILWTMEEALRCEGLSSVVAHINQVDLTASRRLQLAVEKNTVTGFLIRQYIKPLPPIACIAQWKVRHHLSQPVAMYSVTAANRVRRARC